VNAHSLYFETLGELGVIGGALLAVLLLVILGGMAARLRKPNRAVYGALLAAGLAWALNAAIDWDWQIPAITFWLFAAGGIALAARPGTGPSRPLRGVTRAVLVVGLLLLAITPARLAMSDRLLTRTVSDYKAGQCGPALDAAHSSSSWLPVRPEPYQVVSFCESSAGRGAASIAAMNQAISRDPHNWKYRYGLAIVQARTGVDPRPAARLALRLNPREAQARAAVARFRGRTRTSWRRELRRLQAETK
jgi:hypothetical protein